MYEGHELDLFKWKDVNGALTGLEHSLMTYNASAYPSGLKNRKANAGKSKGKTYTFDECKDVPIDSVPMNKLPVIKNDEFPEIADVYMSDATQPITLTEGKMLGPAASSSCCTMKSGRLLKKLSIYHRWVMSQWLIREEWANT